MSRRSKTDHRSGFVSLLGRPNAGKSTLLNALLGEKVAIVADKPQTTRTTIQGVLTLPEAQIVFVDTPGIHFAEDVFNRRMMQTLGEAVSGRDLLLFLADATRPVTAEDEHALEWVKKSGAPAFLLLNKIDMVAEKPRLLPLLARYRDLHPFEEFLPISALTGEGLDELKREIVRRLPQGPAYFPEDHLTDQPERFLAGELLRESILAVTRQEVPHAVAVTVDEWKEEGRLLRLSATIHVERPGQKVILLGARGERLKQIATAARQEIEARLDRKVFLSVFIKLSPHWRENESFLRDLDWRAMAGTKGPGEE